MKPRRHPKPYRWFLARAPRRDLEVSLPYVSHRYVCNRFVNKVSAICPNKHFITESTIDRERRLISVWYRWYQRSQQYIWEQLFLNVFRQENRSIYSLLDDRYCCRLILNFRKESRSQQVSRPYSNDSTANWNSREFATGPNGLCCVLMLPKIATGRPQFPIAQSRYVVREFVNRWLIREFADFLAFGGSACSASISRRGGQGVQKRSSLDLAA